MHGAQHCQQCTAVVAHTVCMSVAEQRAQQSQADDHRLVKELAHAKVGMLLGSEAAVDCCWCSGAWNGDEGLVLLDPCASAALTELVYQIFRFQSSDFISLLLWPCIQPPSRQEPDCHAALHHRHAPRFSVSTA